MHAIDDPDDSRFRGNFGWEKRETGLLAATPIDQFTRPNADRIETDELLPAFLQFRRERLHDQHALRLQIRILAGGPYLADYASDLHRVTVYPNSSCRRCQ